MQGYGIILSKQRFNDFNNSYIVIFGIFQIVNRGGVVGIPPPVRKFVTKNCLENVFKMVKNQKIFRLSAPLVNVFNKILKFSAKYSRIS